MSRPSIRHIADFPDKLNPMLVKELRQGLRGISFVVLFIALQAFLALILLTTAAGASYQNAGHLLSRIIFFFFSFSVLIVQPLRGVSALSTEIKGKTIDLLCLTRLSAWRITYGKWISIVSQSALLLTAIIPYLIMRYFFGDMRIFSELLLVLSIFLLSATFTAITVSLSSMTSVIIRVLLPLVGACFVFGWICGTFVSGRHDYQNTLELVSLNSGPGTMAYVSFVVACLYTTWLCLDLGTSKIAPVAENRATPKRLITLGLILLTSISLSLAQVETGIICSALMILCIPISIFSLTEDPHIVPPITAPFVRKGAAGRLMGRFLYPGWATGLLFVLSLYAILQATFFFNPESTPAEEQMLLATINSFFACLFMAVALTRLLARKNTNRLGLFLLFIMSQVLILAALQMVDFSYANSNYFPYFWWVPTTYHALAYNHTFPLDQVISISYINVMIYFVIALITSRPVWKQIRRTEQTLTPN